MFNTDLLVQWLQHAPVDLPEQAPAAFEQYLQLLSQWQSVINLSAIEDPQAQVIYHVLDTLSILQYLKGNRWVDVGTGAGIPGIILAIARPDVQLTLVESVGKKMHFLRQVCARLGLKHVELVQSRVETFHPQQLFDGVITRAFAPLPRMVALTEHLCAPTGRFYAMKGKYPEEEIAQLPTSVEVESVAPLKVPGLVGERHLIILTRSEP